MELFVSMLLSYPFGFFCIFFGMVILGLYFFIIKKLLVVIIGVAAVGMGILYYGAGYTSIMKEDICQKEAMKIVGSHWKEEVPVSAEDIQQVPHLFEKEKGVKITRLFKEQLRCEREHTFFSFF